MKGKLAFDPDDYDYGPATERIRQILALATAVDWFMPPPVGKDTADALFAEHRALCREHSELFPARFSLEHVRGDWADFTKLCTQVRYPQSSYDWKFLALKPMTHAHAVAHGWSNKSIAVDARWSRPGDLFLQLNESVMVNAIAPRPDLRAFVPERCQEAAGFYWGFATGDLHDAIQWELAEPEAPSGHNPFIPLLRCYASGYWPFALSAADVRMFSFTRGELPVARVVR